MAVRSGKREGCPEFLDGPPSDRRRDEYSRLSLLAHYEEGSHGSSGVRDGPGAEGPHPPLRNDAGDGADPDQRIDHHGAGTVHGGGLRAGDDGDWDVGERLQDQGIREAAALDGAEFPDVSHRYWGPVGAAPPG